VSFVQGLNLDVLESPVWSSLLGPHALLAEKKGQATRYAPGVCPFGALAPDHDLRAWDDLATLVGPGSVATLAGRPAVPAAGWEIVGRIAGVQMIDLGVEGCSDEEAVVLRDAHVPEMLDLVRRTRPGPFLPRTIQMGTYIGIRRGDVLVAMAGERLHPPGWCEISAVCTDAGYRGEGLASRLVRAVVANIRARQETPFLHVTRSNTGAIRLYQTLGFAIRRELSFDQLRAPPIAPVGSGST
jgi:ribosomal protein S18 acetylase RimI-like enzyme